MIRHFIALNIFLLSTQALPMGEITNSTTICEQPREDGSFSLCHMYNWFTHLSKLIRTTGDALEGVGQEYYAPLKGAGDHLDEVADYLDDYHEEGVRAGYEWVKEHVPKAQDKITDLLKNKVPEASDYVTKQIDSVPENYREEFGETLYEILDTLPFVTTHILPEVVEDPMDYIDSAVKELPAKTQLKRFLSHVDNLVEGDGWVEPAHARVEGKMQSLLDMVEEMFDTEEKKN